MCGIQMCGIQISSLLLKHLLRPPLHQDLQYKCTETELQFVCTVKWLVQALCCMYHNSQWKCKSLLNFAWIKNIRKECAITLSISGGSCFWNLIAAKLKELGAFPSFLRNFNKGMSVNRFRYFLHRSYCQYKQLTLCTQCVHCSSAWPKIVFANSKTRS